MVDGPWNWEQRYEVVAVLFASASTMVTTAAVVALTGSAVLVSVLLVLAHRVKGASPPWETTHPVMDDGPVPDSP